MLTKDASKQNTLLALARLPIAVQRHRAPR